MECGAPVAVTTPTPCARGCVRQSPSGHRSEDMGIRTADGRGRDADDGIGGIPDTGRGRSSQARTPGP